MIDILDMVPALGDDVEMPYRRDHFHPLGSLLPIIKSSLQTFMQPIFPQDSLLNPIKKIKVFVECRSLLEPHPNKVQPSTFTSKQFYKSSKKQSDAALKNCFQYRQKFLFFGLCAKAAYGKMNAINSALRWATQTLGCPFSPWAQWFSTTRPIIQRK
jgi:hypothetical protein